MLGHLHLTPLWALHALGFGYRILEHLPAAVGERESKRGLRDL